MARLKIEEIVLIGVSLFFLITLFFLGFFSNSPAVIFKTGWATISSSVEFWIWGMLFFCVFLIFRIYLLFIKINSRKGLSLNFDAEKFKNLFCRILPLLKTPFLFLITFALGIMATGLIQQTTRTRLINSRLLNADELLTGGHTPLWWFHSPANPLIDVFHALSPVIIFSFTSLGAILGVLAIIFYFDKNKKPFKGFVVSIFIVLALSTPLWYFFPANSPANVLLHGLNYVPNYEPGEAVKIFQRNSWESQKNSLPVTTMPSMHWAWSIIVVYYLFKKERKTIVPALIWLSLDLFGTIYLGNHYLIDGLAAIPLAALAIFSADMLVKIEGRYYRQNQAQEEFLEKIGKWLAEPFEGLKGKLSK